LQLVQEGGFSLIPVSLKQPLLAVGQCQFSRHVVEHHPFSRDIVEQLLMRASKLQVFGIHQCFQR
jgi:hypothetical protein